MRVRERCTYIPTTWTSARPPIAVIVEIKVEIEVEIEGVVTVVIRVEIEGGVTVVITVVIKVVITVEKGCTAFDNIMSNNRFNWKSARREKSE